MTNRRTIILIVTVAVFSFCSCQEDPIPPGPPVVSTYDTIFPLDYFPAFPGSYWKYVDLNNDTTTIQTDSVYHLDHYTIEISAFHSDTFYVPRYNNYKIWGYEAHTGPVGMTGEYPFKTVLKDDVPVGNSWAYYFFGGAQISRRVVAKDTTITISSNSYYPTIVVEEYNVVPGNLTARRFYTKDIGLIKEEIIINLDSIVSSKEIYDYYINY